MEVCVCNSRLMIASLEQIALAVRPVSRDACSYAGSSFLSSEELCSSLLERRELLCLHSQRSAFGPLAWAWKHLLTLRFS
jgi:hypothetical protein